MLARVAVRYPSVPILFLETRPLAEEWTFRYLGAALAEALAESDLEDRASVEGPSPADEGSAPG